MVKHLIMENEQICKKLFSANFEPGITFVLENALHHFHEGMTPNVSNRIAELWQNKDKSFGFLTFNYTDTLSLVFSAAEEFLRLQCKLTDFHFNPEILHIHGSLMNDVVLGVDNKTQLSGLPYHLSVRGKRAFIKPYFNEQYDTQRLLQARKMIIESTIICVYGFSMGETDQMWVNLLAEWLRNDANHHLIYFEYDEHMYARCNFDELMDAEEEKKHKLLHRLGISPTSEIATQLHIPIEQRLFAFVLKKGIKEIEQELREYHKHRQEHCITN